MNDTNRGGPAGQMHDADEELDAAWDRFEVGLARYLATMVDPDEGDHLIIELPDPDPAADGGCLPYAQFAAFGDGRMVRAEIAGNGHLQPQYRLGSEAAGLFASHGWSGNDDTDENWYREVRTTRADQVASQVVWALRICFRIAHPHLLTYQAWGPAADGVAALGLCATDDVPVDDPQPPSGNGSKPVRDALALKPSDRADLIRMVEGLLHEKYQAAPTVDEDGDFVLSHMDQPVWIRVRKEQPAVEIVARVAHDVWSRRATAVEIGLLNRDNPWVKWTLHERTVWQSIVLPGNPFAPLHLEAMLDLFMAAMTSTRDDLAHRTGAKVA